MSPVKLSPAIPQRHKSIDVSPMLASLVVNENKMIRDRAESLAYRDKEYQRSVKQRINFQIKNVKQQLSAIGKLKYDEDLLHHILTLNQANITLSRITGLDFSLKSKNEG